jgi:terminase small subunit / prophage DNA-packing protein
MGMTLNRSAVAEVFGVQVTTVDIWVRAGCPHWRQGRNVLFDSAAVSKWRIARALSDDPTPEDGPTLGDARRRHEAAKARLVEIELADRMKEVAPVDVLTRVIRQELGHVTDKLLALPERARPTFATVARDEEGADRMVRAFSELIREALDELSVLETSRSR